LCRPRTSAVIAGPKRASISSAGASSSSQAANNSAATRVSASKRSEAAINAAPIACVQVGSPVPSTLPS